MPTPNPNGQSDSYFISWVRRKLRDQPAWFPQTIPTNGTDGVLGTAGAKPYRVQRAPIWTGGIAPSITAPAIGNGNVWLTAFDTVPTATSGQVGNTPPTPVISDGGAGGSWPAVTVQVVITLSTGSGSPATPQGPFSLASNALAIVVNHQLTVAALSGLPSSATFVNVYVISPVGNAGFVGTIAVANGATVATTFAAPPVAATGLPVLILTDTGEIVFPAAPPNGNLNIQYPSYRFSDQQIKDALYDGLKAMYPQIWQLAFDTSLIPSPVFYEYTLPNVFADMRVVLLKVELRIPNITVVPYKRYKGWSRPTPLTLAFMDRFSPAGVIRLSYNAPYSLLSDLETAAMHLPCYYAMHLLLKEQDAMRTRATEMVPQTGEGGAKPQDAMQLSRDWKDTFDTELERLGRPQPIRPDPVREYEISA